MKAPKRVLTLTTAEHRLMIRGLLQFRNKLIDQGRYTDAVDELLIKLQRKPHWWKGSQLHLHTGRLKPARIRYYPSILQ